MTDLGLAHKNGRCAHGFHPSQRQFHDCPDLAPIAPLSDKDAAYSLFASELAAAVRADGTVHACDMRPRTHGRIESRLLSSCWSRARREGLLHEVGHERSNDEAGKNAGRMEPYYSYGTQAAVNAA